MRRILDDVSQRANPVRSVHGWRPVQDQNTAVISILTHHSVYALIIEQARTCLPNETGGFLLGYVALDPDSGCWYVEVDEVLPIIPTDCDPIHFKFTWRDVDRVRSHREREGKALIGWYHTHPGLGVFLSETDLEKTHTQLFNEPFQVALVYDPMSGRAGYFYWEASGVLDAEPVEWREFELSEEQENSAEVIRPEGSGDTEG